VLLHELIKRGAEYLRGRFTDRLRRVEADVVELRSPDIGKRQLSGLAPYWARRFRAKEILNKPEIK